MTSGSAVVVLRTRRLILRPPQLDDVPAVVRLVGDWEVAKQTTRIPHPYTEADARAWIAAPEAGVIQYFRHLVTKQDGTLLGSIGLFEKDRQVILGYWFGRAFWGQGFATEAVDAVLAHAFEVLGVKRVIAETFAENTRSRRVLEKVGFRYIGDDDKEFQHRGGLRRRSRYVRDA